MSPLPTFVALACFSCSFARAAPQINRRNSSSSGTFELIADYSGDSFFDAFTAYTGPDPTHGFVNYTDMAFAAENELVGFIVDSSSKTNQTSAYVGVDHTTPASGLASTGRNSVRLLSKQTFNAGSLFVVDVKHMPVQYGIWPAVWLLGTAGTWPSAGELDILETTHKESHNAITIHASKGCEVNNATTSFQGRLLDTDCNAGNAATGCGVAAYNQNKFGNISMPTAGSAFNRASGGVYIAEHQANQITVWFMPRGDLPADLTNGHPKPSTWKQKPLAKFAGSCSFSTFQDMQLIINIDFCGDWAGRVWESSGAANATGVTTCNEFVANNPEKFRDSYFEIAGVKIFTNNGQKPGLFAPATSKRHAAPQLKNIVV